MALGSGDFRKLWFARTVSWTGSEISGVALPLAAVALGAGPLHMAVLRSAGSISNLLLGPFAGVWADRVRRQPLLVGCDLARALLAGTIPLAALLGVLGLGQLLVAAVAVGALSTLYRAAQGGLLVAIVPRERLAEANGRLAASRSAAHVAGPGIGGALVQLLTAPIAVAVDALSFLASGLTLLTIRAAEPPRPAEGARSSLWREAGDGFAFVFGHPTLRRLVIGLFAFELFDAAFFAQYVLYVTGELGVPAAALGVIFAIGGVGGLLGAALAAWAARRFGLGRALVGGVLLAGLGDALIPWAGTQPLLAVPLLGLAELLVSLGAAVFGVNEESLRQQVTPDGLLGRVGATAGVVGGAATVLGSFGGGLVAGLVGLPTLLAVSATATLAAGLWLLASPVWRLGRG